MRAAAVALAVSLLALAILLVLTLGGCDRVPYGDVPEADTPWCYAYEFTLGGDHPRTAVSCFQTLGECRAGQKKLERFGLLWDAVRFDACVEGVPW